MQWIGSTSYVSPAPQPYTSKNKLQCPQHDQPQQVKFDIDGPIWSTLRPHPSSKKKKKKVNLKTSVLTTTAGILSLPLSCMTLFSPCCLLWCSFRVHQLQQTQQLYECSANTPGGMLPLPLKQNVQHQNSSIN